MKNNSNIVITGSKGFIAKNLFYKLRENNYKNIYRVHKNTNKNTLRRVLKKAHYIYHLAGENRPKNKKLFYKNNAHFTQKICEILRYYKNKSTIVFTSSSQVKKKNQYGISKNIAEKYLLIHKKENKSKISILRLPNVFGKFSKPYYNSFLATLCYNISRGQPVKCDNKKISLVYIDDVIKKFIFLIKKNKIQTYEKIKPIYKISIKNLRKKIDKFNKFDTNLFIDEVSNGFNKKLYSTFLYFIPKEKWLSKLENKKDDRGDFIEFLKNKNSGQISIFSININKTRGGHYHHTKNERFLILNGKVRVTFKNIITNKIVKYIIDANFLKVFKSIPGWYHEIKNISHQKVFGIVWSNEIFNKKKSDTYSLPLK